MVVSRDGEFAASGNIDGVVQLYDMKEKKFVSRFASKFPLVLFRPLTNT